MADCYDPLPDLAALVGASIYMEGIPAAYRLAVKLRITPGTAHREIEGRLREALGIGDPKAAPKRLARGEPLSVRELGVAQCVAEGLTNKQTADRLAVAERTVEAHLRRVYAKTGITSRVGLMRWVKAQAATAAPVTRPG